ncbi:hypothetical protein CAOG_010214 [Capsaspora owczarzaki ATCC 30864]|uniref:Uncharacterized protein n=1 Tax=Capsaspora owczarzaki (strain ATCC 30864) TaxID=595528 RepID=A0A0D2X5T0_CAPO3|nr:hypothetical protein CAOG_010214 [Capsaspora owczarzaki ATCC 30864]
MEGESAAAEQSSRWLQAVEAAPVGEKRDVALAAALKLLFPDPVVLPGGEIYHPKGWSSRNVAKLVGQAGHQCGHTTIHSWKMKHAPQAEWIRSSPFNQVLQLVKDGPKPGAPTIFTPDEMEQCIQLLEGFARAGKCLTKKQAGVYFSKLADKSPVSGGPRRRRFTQKQPSRQWWKDFLQYCDGRLAIRKG